MSPVSLASRTLQCSHRFLIELCTFIPRACCGCADFGNTRAGIERAGSVTVGRVFRARMEWDNDRVCRCASDGDTRATARDRKAAVRDAIALEGFEAIVAAAIVNRDSLFAG